MCVDSGQAAGRVYLSSDGKPNEFSGGISKLWWWDLE